MANIQQLLNRCLPLIPQHGFTRKTIALASASCVLDAHADPDLNVAEDARGKEQSSRRSNGAAPLSETAISALFGAGDEACRTLIKAWLSEGVNEMRYPWKTSLGDTSNAPPTIADVLQKRLEWNRPVLNHLPEVCLTLMSGEAVVG